MMKKNPYFQTFKKILSTQSFFSWEGLLKRAVIIFIIFAIAHLLNGREYAGGLFGTYNVIGIKRIIGVVYVFFYFLSLFVAPIFLLTSAFIFLTDKLCFRQNR
jgi:hypothetical protein